MSVTKPEKKPRRRGPLAKMIVGRVIEGKLYHFTRYVFKTAYLEVRIKDRDRRNKSPVAGSTRIEDPDNIVMQWIKFGPLTRRK
jgi:hypothetical protein